MKYTGQLQIAMKIRPQTDYHKLKIPVEIEKKKDYYCIRVSSSIIRFFFLEGGTFRFLVYSSYE